MENQTQNFQQNGYQQNGYQQNGYQQNYPPTNHPNNYLVWAILCTILCCLPFGIAAIVKSASVDRLWAEGRFQEAENASSSAKKLIWIGVILSIVIWIGYFALIALGVFTGFADDYYY